MFSSAAKASAENRDSEDARSSMDLSLRMDYYGGDFVEDGSFLVLNTDGMSLSPSTPQTGKSEDGDEKNLDMEVLNEDENDTPFASFNNSSIQQPQVLGEDPESSVESVHCASVQQDKENPDANASQLDTALNSMTNMSLASGSISSASTDAHLAESSEEINLLMAENKKLTELLADSNEKMKLCIATTEKLKVDHEEYKKKNEASREVISQLRQDNEMLKSQVSMAQSQVNLNVETQSLDKELLCKSESLQKQSQTISELNERLDTVLTYNGKLNEERLASQKANEELKKELEKIQTEKETAVGKIGTMIAEIDAGRKAVAKFNEYQIKIEAELAGAKEKISSLEASIEEKTKLTDSLRRIMEDTVTALERRNEKLNQKEQEISLLTTKLAAINAETECLDRLRALEIQCQNHRVEIEQLREERAKLIAEKDALLAELNSRNQQMKEINDAFDTYRRQNGADYVHRGDARNDNSADNANESLPSPLTSLPSVAGQLVGFVRRELLGWEDQSGAAVDTNMGNSGGGGAAAETVVQQPKQEAIPPCPICRKTFASLERLQTHASNCGIDNDDGQPDDPFVFP